MYIISIKNPNRARPWYYVAQGYRKDGKVKQSIVANLGRHKKVEDAYLHAFADYIRASERLSRIEYAMANMQEKRA